MAGKNQDKSKAKPDGLTEGLKKRKVSLTALRRLLLAAKKASTKTTAPEIVRSQKFNLKVFETQLSTLEAAIEGDELSGALFNELPAYKRKQLITRLDNIKQRALKRVDDVANDVQFQNHSFTCLNDYNKCMKMKAASPFWCGLAFYICFLRSISPFIK